MSPPTGPAWRAACALAALAGCASPPRAPRFPPPPRELLARPRVVDVAPLAVPEVRGGLVLATTPGRGAVVAFAPLGGAARVSDGRAPLRVRARPVRRAPHRSPDGTAPAATAATALARLAAADAVGAPADRLWIEVDPPGAADAAASGAVAVAALAAVTGAAPRPGAAVAGAVAPDGTLVPAVPGPATPAATAPPGDLRAAFHAVTGRALPAPRPVPPAAMALSAAERARVRARAGALRLQLALYWDALLSAKHRPRLPAAVAAWVDGALAAGADGERLARAGRDAASYARLADALALAAAADLVLRSIDAVARGDLDGAAIAIEAATARPGGADDARTRAATAAVDTVDRALAAADAFAAASAAAAMEVWAEARGRDARAALAALRDAPPDPSDPIALADRVAAVVAPVALARGRADAWARAAADVLDIEADGSGLPLAIDGAAVARTGAARRAAAAAALAWLEASAVDALAARTARPRADAETAFASAAPGWIAARALATAGGVTGGPPARAAAARPPGAGEAGARPSPPAATR
ncbi:MAG: hypothetical protein D6689_10940, partial [Deltaproteobacteria bacterium]